MVLHYNYLREVIAVTFKLLFIFTHKKDVHCTQLLQAFQIVVYCITGAAEHQVGVKIFGYL